MMCYYLNVHFQGQKVNNTLRIKIPEFSLPQINVKDEMEIPTVAAAHLQAFSLHFVQA